MDRIPRVKVSGGRRGRARSKTGPLKRWGRTLTTERPRRLGWTPRDLLILFVTTFRQWLADKAPKLAAALSYYTAFSIGPIILIAVAGASLIFGADAAREAIGAQVGQMVGGQAADSINELLRNSSSKPSSGILATIFGVIALIFGATGVFGELQDSLNILWMVRKKKGRGFLGTLKDRLLSFGMVAVIGFLLLVSLVVSAGLQALRSAVFGGEEAGIVLKILQELLSVGMIGVLFAFMFKVLPDAKTRWRDVWIGAFLTAALFTVGKFLMGLYLAKNSAVSAYGAAGSLALLLLWVFYSSQIFFFGAEFTKVFADTHGGRPAPDPDAVAASTPSS